MNHDKSVHYYVEFWEDTLFIGLFHLYRIQSNEKFSHS
jgi:hypothetical protein